MKRALLLSLSFCFLLTLTAQTTNWSTDIAPIFYSNCTNCHHDGGLAPFSLLDYQTAYSQRFNILSDVNNKIMPPWPPDPKYRRFAHERLLSGTDIARINDWVTNGAPMGDTTQAPAKPVYTNASALGTPDLSLRIPDFTIPANQTNDLYQCFVVHTNLSQTEYITGIEVIPGNASVVHHVLVYQDTTGQAAINDANTPEPGYAQFGGIGISNPILVAGWVPGSQPSFMPNNMGIKVYANSDLVLQIHYPAGSASKLDSTRINFKLSTGTLRAITLTPILNHFTSIQNGPLSIPANEVKTFEEYYQLPNLADVTVLSVAPHCHLIGKSWLSYGITPVGDTIPLVKIDNWDFHWQGSYGFRNLLKVPKHTKLYAFATYDNTNNNPDNPNSPPQNVSVGESTTDEMMLIYFAYTLYQNGDENIVTDTSALVDITDTTITTGVTELPQNSIVSTPQLYEPVPNPSGNETQFSYFLPEQTANVRVKIYDLNGKLVDELKATGDSGFNLLKYNTANLQQGNYLCVLSANSLTRSKNLVVVH
jgi:hypothetical protein